MSNDLDIFAGPAQVTLYDSTNGYLYLDWCEARIKEKPKKIKSIENQTLLIENNFDFDVKVIRFNSDTLNKLSARNNTKQIIYLVGLDSMVTISNVFIFYFIERLFSSKPHHLTIAGSGGADLVTHKVNLMHPDGKFENDSNSDGLADGWVKSASVNSVEIRASFLSGGGNAQYLYCTMGSDQNIQYKVKAPVKGRIKATASVYVKFDPDVITGDGHLCLGIYARRADGSFITFDYDIFAFTNGEGKRISYTKTIDINELAVELTFIIHNKGGAYAFNALLDNAQLELGKLSNFKEY